MAQTRAEREIHILVRSVQERQLRNELFHFAHPFHSSFRGGYISAKQCSTALLKTLDIFLNSEATVKFITADTGLVFRGLKSSVTV